MATYPEFNVTLHHGMNCDRNSSATNQPVEQFCPKCFTSSKNQPIHCISAPNSSRPDKELLEQITPHGAMAIPILKLQTSMGSSKIIHPHRPEPIFQIQERTNGVRFRQNAFSPLSPQHLNGADSGRRSGTGLGIFGAPQRPDPSPITPGTVEEAKRSTKFEELPSEKGRSRRCLTVPGMVQKIEQKLFNYNASQNVIKRWLVEIISWTISALCMTGIIVVLCIYQQRTLPKWPLGITLNAYVSLLAKIGSAAILFPVSGALGQLKWNWFQAKDNQSKRSKMVWDFE